MMKMWLKRCSEIMQVMLCVLIFYLWIGVSGLGGWGVTGKV